MSTVLSSVNRRLAKTVYAGYPGAVQNTVLAARPKASKPTGFSALEGDRLTKPRLQGWAKLTRQEQIKYLKQHPNSIFHKAPLNKDAPADDQKTDSAPGQPPSPGAAGPAEPPPSAEPSGAGESPPSSPAPTLSMDPKTGIPQREPDQQDKDGIAQAVSDLSEPGALEPGSEHREQAAAVVEEGAEKLIRDHVSPETVAEISDAMADPSKIRVDDAPAEDQPDAAPDPTTVVDDKIQPDTEDEFGDEDERPRRRRDGGGTGIGRKIAILAGCIALGALLTAGAFAFDPTFAFVVGKKVVDHFQDTYNFAQEVFSSVDRPQQNGISVLVTAIADFVRKGELDPTWLDTARAMTA